MRLLTLQEIKNARSVVEPENLKRCGVAYSVTLTYMLALCDMAEEYLKIRSMGHARKSYVLEGNEDGWIIKGSDGFCEPMGKGNNIKQCCLRLLERLNGF